MIINITGVKVMANLQIRIDDTMKNNADTLFTSLGIDIPTAVRMFIAAAIDYHGLPFEVRKRNISELNDGYGSYTCQYGHFHDYKKSQPKIEQALKDVSEPFSSYDDLLRSLDSE
jgi:addiction module RelB/DinJ family antitoxin